MLKYWFFLSENARIVTVKTALFIPKSAELGFLDDFGNVLRKILVDVSISDFENEVLMGDVAIDALDIEVVSFSRGLWRLRGETVIKQSVSPETW